MTTDPCLAVLSRNEISRVGLGKVLEDEGFEIAVMAGSADALLNGAGAGTVDVVLLEAGSYRDGLRDCEQLRDMLPHARIVVMVDAFTAEDVASAFQSSAIDGYLVRAIACKPLAGALRLVALGEKVFPSQMIETLAAGMPMDGPPRTRPILTGQLSGRELEILYCLMSGESNKIISRRLCISDATVKVHIKAILRKLKVVNRTQAAIWAVSHGMGEHRPSPSPRPMDAAHGAARMQMPMLQAAAAPC